MASQKQPSVSAMKNTKCACRCWDVNSVSIPERCQCKFLIRHFTVSGTCCLWLQNCPMRKAQDHEPVMGISIWGGARCM